MIYLSVTMLLWAATAVAAYWWFYEPAREWLNGFNDAQAAIIGPQVSREIRDVAVAKTRRVLLWIEAGVFILALLISAHPLFGFWALGLGLFLIRYFGKYAQERSASRFDDQLVDVAFAFRNSLKAGLSLQQTMQMIAADFRPPASDQFRMAIREIQVGASIEEAVIGVIMLENAAMVQMMTEAAGDPGAEFSRADIEKLRQEVSQPEQFAINFNYLVRRVQRRER